jgi:Sec-independent protein translocase protein TatA
MALLGAAALLFFGPDQLPRVVRKVGQFTREVQNTSQSFLREMERAAEIHETPPASNGVVPVEPYPAESYEAFPIDEAEFATAEAPAVEKLAQPRPALEHEQAAAPPEAAAFPEPPSDAPVEPPGPTAGPRTEG